MTVLVHPVSISVVGGLLLSVSDEDESVVEDGNSIQSWYDGSD